MISLADFCSIVKHAPLISIDFIVEYHHKILLGQRVNKPAQGYYFTPGGRIFKNESLSSAIMRISDKELGRSLDIQQVQFHGVFEHFYDHSFIDNSISTHYVVLAYKYITDIKFTPPLTEHRNYTWLDLDNLMAHPIVHHYVKDYFRKGF